MNKLFCTNMILVKTKIVWHFFNCTRWRYTGLMVSVRCAAFQYTCKIRSTNHLRVCVQTITADESGWSRDMQVDTFTFHLKASGQFMGDDAIYTLRVQWLQLLSFSKLIQSKSTLTYTNPALKHIAYSYHLHIQSKIYLGLIPTIPSIKSAYALKSLF